MFHVALERTAKVFPASTEAASAAIADAATGSQTASAPIETTTFSARLPVHLKKALERAADLRGQSLSDFVLSCACERAMMETSPEQAVAQRPLDNSVLARFRDADRMSHIS
jgi:hypothetical protein